MDCYFILTHCISRLKIKIKIEIRNLFVLRYCFIDCIYCVQVRRRRDIEFRFLHQISIHFYFKIPLHKRLQIYILQCSSISHNFQTLRFRNLPKIEISISASHHILYTFRIFVVQTLLPDFITYKNIYHRLHLQICCSVVFIQNCDDKHYVMH